MEIAMRVGGPDVVKSHIPNTRDQDDWSRVKERLRAKVGDDVYESWFARMSLDRIEKGTAHLTVATKFLKIWIESHYSDKVLDCLQGQLLDVERIEISVRSCVLRTVAPTLAPKPAATGRARGNDTRAEPRADAANFKGSPLDERLTFGSFVVGQMDEQMCALIRPQEPKRVKIEDVQRIVARHYNISRSDLLSSRRTQNMVRPRHVAMYLAKVLTPRSFPEIGRRFGGKDHATVLHAVRRVAWSIGIKSMGEPLGKLPDYDEALAEEVASLKRQLQE